MTLLSFSCSFKCHIYKLLQKKNLKYKFTNFYVYRYKCVISHINTLIYLRALLQLTCRADYLFRKVFDNIFKSSDLILYKESTIIKTLRTKYHLNNI
jgi:hypothetical protein